MAPTSDLLRVFSQLAADSDKNYERIIDLIKNTNNSELFCFFENIEIVTKILDTKESDNMVKVKSAFKIIKWKSSINKKINILDNIRNP
jgi:hypothetical protein